MSRSLRHKGGTTGYVWVVRKNKKHNSPLRHLYSEEVRGQNQSSDFGRSNERGKTPDHTYPFTNVKTGKLDNKFVGIAYPGAWELSRFGMGNWIRRRQKRADGLSCRSSLETTLLWQLSFFVFVFFAALFVAATISRPITNLGGQWPRSAIIST